MASAMPHAMLRSFATPNTTTFLSLNNSIAFIPLPFVPGSLEHVEGAFDVALRINAKCDQRLCAVDPLHLCEVLGDDGCNPLPLGYAENRDQVPLARYRIDFR